MSSSNVARIAGVAGILSVLTFAAGFVVTPDPMKPGALGMTLFVASNVLVLPLFYALFVFLRAQAQTVALVALILGVIGVAVGMFAPSPATNPLLFNLSSALGGIAIVIFGYLGLQNAKMPRALAIVTIVLGVASLISVVVEVVGLGVIILFAVWATWLSWLLLKGKLI